MSGSAANPVVVDILRKPPQLKVMVEAQSTTRELIMSAIVIGLTPFHGHSGHPPKKNSVSGGGPEPPHKNFLDNSLLTDNFLHIQFKTKYLL